MIETFEAKPSRIAIDDLAMVGGELVVDRPVEEVIESLFNDTEVKYLHARTATVGCYLTKIVRA